MQNRKNCYNVDNRHSGQQSSESHMIADLVRKLQNFITYEGWVILDDPLLTYEVIMHKVSV